MKGLLSIALFFLAGCLQAQTIRVGAKHFNEGYILSEIIARLLEGHGYTVERRFNLGGTLVCFEALKNNEIDIYPEYSGTLAAEILRDPGLRYADINTALRKNYSLEIAEPYGFSNTYALICRRNLSDEKKITTISDLRTHPELKPGLSYEFIKRQDGWEYLAKAYSLPHQPLGLEHGLAYPALDQGTIDFSDAYSTDGEIAQYGLVVLDDDLNFFPAYEATSLYRLDLPRQVKEIIAKLGGKIDATRMQAMNGAVLYGNKTFAEVALVFLQEEKLISKEPVEGEFLVWDILEKTITHVELTLMALLGAIVLALPLGVILYWKPSIARAVLYFTGLLQTIPSIALLAMMIPVFGIGKLPAVIALFLYALLPILRNTVTGLQAVDPLLKKVSAGIGMNRYQQLRYVELPLALPVVLAGIRTAAVINVGTATLAAFIGAGGLGDFIVTGLALNNTAMILRGAIPAAILALLVEFIFTAGERWWIPKHLR